MPLSPLCSVRISLSPTSATGLRLPLQLSPAHPLLLLRRGRPARAFQHGPLDARPDSAPDQAVQPVILSAAGPGAPFVYGAAIRGHPDGRLGDDMLSEESVIRLRPAEEGQPALLPPRAGRPGRDEAFPVFGVNPAVPPRPPGRGTSQPVPAMPLARPGLVLPEGRRHSPNAHAARGQQHRRIDRAPAEI